jgi:hypothetical protein
MSALRTRVITADREWMTARAIGITTRRHCWKLCSISTRQAIDIRHAKAQTVNIITTEKSEK